MDAGLWRASRRRQELHVEPIIPCGELAVTGFTGVDVIETVSLEGSAGFTRGGTLDSNAQKGVSAILLMPVPCCFCKNAVHNRRESQISSLRFFV